MKNYMILKRGIYKSIADRIGFSAEEFIDLPLDERRKHIEEITGRSMKIKGDRNNYGILYREEIDLTLDEALR